MTIATIRLTLDEYLAYDDGTDNRYELVDGLYEETVFEGSQTITSTVLPEFRASATKVLRLEDRLDC